MKRNTLNTFITATLIMLLGVSSSAKAIVPMGDLMGTTTVTWGAETTSEIQTSIQSILVPAPPILLGPADLPSISGPSLVGDDALQYTITSNANGVDTYTLTLTREIDDVQGGAFGFSGKFSGKEAEVTLGATAAMEAANADADAIKVPSDGVIDNAVNGITNGDTVSINNNPYTVGEVVDDGNTATIPLTPPLISPVAFGDRIAEREKFEVSLDTVGTITEGAETGTVTITVTATSKSPGAPEADDDVVLTLQTPVGPSVEKYVRNVTPENDGNPPDNLEWVGEGFAYKYPPEDGTFYFRSQLNDDDARDPSKNPDAKVKAKKDDILEYLIVLKAGNQEDQTGITLNETLSPFAAYLGGMTKVNNQPFKDNDDGYTAFGIFENLPVIDAEGEPLIIAKNTSAYLTYQVTVIGGEEDKQEPSGGEQAGFYGDAPYTGCVVALRRFKGYESDVTDCYPDGTTIPREGNDDGRGWLDNPDRVHRMSANNLVEYTACWCEGPRTPAQYCDDAGWVVGKNSARTNNKIDASNGTQLTILKFALDPLNKGESVFWEGWEQEVTKADGALCVD